VRECIPEGDARGSVQLTLWREPRASVPLTRDGLPDLGAMRALGLTAQADRWSARLNFVCDYQLRDGATPHGERTRLVRALCARYGLSVRTAYRLIRLASDGGAAALVPRLTRRRGRTCLPRELQRMLAEFFLDQRRPTVAQVYRCIVLRYYARTGDLAPSVSTLGRWIRANILPLARTAFREGPRAYMAKMAPKGFRSWADLRPNEWWVADHRRCDRLVVCADGQARRPWVTMVTDVHSAAIVGYCLCERPNTASVCSALRSAILRYGLPSHFLRDRGREFTARRLGGKPQRMLAPGAADLAGASRWPARMPDECESPGLWAALGVQLHTTNPYHAWSKPIESIFSAFSRVYERLGLGWTGRSAETRPEALALQIKRGLLLRWAEFQASFCEQVGDWNESHVCGDRPAPPVQMYAGHIPRIPAPETLSFLMQGERQALVHQEGVKVAGRWFWADELALLVGCRVRLRWDPADPSYAYVYADGDRVIVLEPAERLRWGEPGPALGRLQRGRGQQAAYLGAVRRQIKGATPAAWLDPLGEVRAVAQRVRLAQDAAAAAQAAARTEAELRRLSAAAQAGGADCAQRATSAPEVSAAAAEAADQEAMRRESAELRAAALRARITHVALARVTGWSRTKIMRCLTGRAARWWRTDFDQIRRALVVVQAEGRT